MYEHRISDATWQAMRKKASRRSVQWVQIPGPDETRIVLSTEPLTRDAVQIPDTDRKQFLTKVGDERPLDRRQAGGSRGFLPADPRNQRKSSAKLIGFWNRNTIRTDRPSDHLVELAASVGLEARQLSPTSSCLGGIWVDTTETDPALAMFRALVEFVPLHRETPTGIRNSPPAPTDEPPWSVYERRAA